MDVFQCGIFLRAIGVSHTQLPNMNFDRIFELTAGVNELFIIHDAVLQDGSLIVDQYIALNIHIKLFFGALVRGIWSGVFFVSAEVCDSRNWNSLSKRFVGAPPSGGGSNAPRPAVSVSHIDVNARTDVERDKREV